MGDIKLLPDDDTTGVKMRANDGLIYRVHPDSADRAIMRGWYRYTPPGVEVPRKEAREWDMKWERGGIRFRPLFDVKKEKSAWPYPDGEWVRVREQQIADFARRTGDEMECLRDKLWAMEGAAREAADNLVDARESLKFGSHEYICAVAAHDVLRDALGDPRPAKGEIQEAPASEAAIRSLLCRAALRGWRRGRRNQEPAQEEIADDLLLEAGAAPEEEGANAQ